MDNCIRFGELTQAEISACASHGHLALLPVGCTAAHGPLPVGIESWLMEELALAAARRAQADYSVCSLVLPVFPFAPLPPAHRASVGSIHLPEELHGAVVYFVLVSLAEQGFRRIVVWQGCSDRHLAPIIERFNVAQGGLTQACLPVLLHEKLWQRHHTDVELPDDTFDRFACAIISYLRPAALAPETWQERSPASFLPDPVLGERLWDESVRGLALTLRAIAQGQPRGSLVPWNDA